MSLELYNKKRRFSETPEPEGKQVKDGKEPIFVVQRHDASHLHYDFRLELEGALRSWAVPKGPSLYPGDKRLAVAVEDHPISYATFEGDIPGGNYGAGHVDVWDSGTYMPVNEAGASITPKEFVAALEKGHARFVMHGQNLQGGFSLLRMKQSDKNWLLLKAKDDFALEEGYDIEAVSKAGAAKKGAKKKEAPQKENTPESPAIEKKLKHFIHPMTARLGDGPFDGDDWLFEIKWDGYRAIAEIAPGQDAKLYSRNGLPFGEDYPQVYDSVQAIHRPMVLDGEIVAFDEDENPDFQLLQNARSNGAGLLYYVFDLLMLDGKDCTGLPVTERKRLLKEAIPEGGIIRYCDHVVGRGKEFFAIAQQRGLEGIIAKQCNSTYTIGTRSPHWLKIKHVLTDEAIILGYTEPKGARKHFGALILGTYQEGKLTYIGHTGTGFNGASLKMLYEQMNRYKRETSPIQEKVKVNAPVQWLDPVLVCAIKYSETTAAGIRRHPVYMGLRKDKSAKEVNGADAAHKKASTKEDMENMKASKDGAQESLKVDGHIVPITNIDKVYWPEEGYTKGDMIAYYAAIAPLILPHLKNRPLSLKRNPNGIRDRGFFHKDAGEDAPDWVKTEKIWSESSARDLDYIICNNKATLLYLANLGCIELNPWHSRSGKLEHPDYMILDLDPSDGNTFEEVIETAKAVKQVLDTAGAEAYCKTSGSTGIHIYVPMGGKYTYDQVVQFAEIIATEASALVPHITSLERSLKKRGQMIYMDYMQNNIGQTVASAYSLRPKPGAPVSTPLEWKELRKGLSIEKFNIRNIAKRVAAKGDLFAPVLKRGVNLTQCLKRLGA